MSSIVEVAKLAGVSTATVSRVLSGKGYVSVKTKSSILKPYFSALSFMPL